MPKRPREDDDDLSDEAGGSGSEDDEESDATRTADADDGSVDLERYIAFLEEERKKLDKQPTTFSVVFFHGLSLATLRQRHPAAKAFLRALAAGGTLRSVTLAAHEAVEPRELPAFGWIGEALGQVPGLRHVSVTQHRAPGTLEALSQVLQHLHHLRSISWDLEEDTDNEGEDDGYQHIHKALADKRSIQEVTVGLGYYDVPDETESLVLGKWMIVFATLPSLRRMTLETCLDDKNFVCLTAPVRLSTLTELRLDYNFGIGHETATAVCSMIGKSDIRQLQLYGSDACTGGKRSRSLGTGTDDSTMPVLLAMQAPHLQTLELEPLTLHTPRSAEAFAQALDHQKLERVDLYAVRWHDAASVEIARAVCHPGLQALGVRFSSGCEASKTSGPVFATELSKHLQQCPALNELTVYLPKSLEEEQLTAFLTACADCPELSVLRIPRCVSWTTQIDQAVAACVTALPRLKVLGIRVDPEDDERGEPLTAPALLAACRAHPALETVQLECHYRQSWCPELQTELRQALTRLKNVRRCRRHFASIAADAAAPSMVAPALFRLRAQPYLVYLGVTSVRSHLAKEEGADSL